MDIRSALRRWFVGENRYDCAQVLGHQGTHYFRYDTSHHLHRGIDRSKLIKHSGMLLLAALLILSGLLQLVSVVIPGIPDILAIIAIAAGIVILLGRQA